MSLRHRPFLLAAVGGFVVSVTAAITLGHNQWMAFSLLGISSFFILYLGQVFAALPGMTATELKRNAAAGDAPPWLFFAITLAIVAAALAAPFLIAGSAPRPASWLVAVGLLSVPLGWLTVHVMAAIHYAHMFWQPEHGADKPRRGLEFPGTPSPDGWDFVYFACVIGMTAQTSDVQIAGRHVRRFNLIHAIVSFFFNTVIVAAAVNAALALRT